jgi:glycosyltransferase involved in cell wall biosynthesis
LDGVAVNYFEPDRSRRLAWASKFGEKLKGEMPRFDIVHLHTVFLWPTLCAARLARRCGIPYILSPRGMLVKGLIKRRNRIAKSLWIELFEKENLTRAAAIHVTAAREAEDLAEFHWKLPQVSQIPNGIEWPEVQGAISPDVAAIMSRRPYALFFGRLSWKKGIELLLEAFARTRTGHLVIAGTDDEGLSQSLRKSIDAFRLTGRVQILARTIDGADKHELFRGARLFALPSLSENFGNTVLEALAAGLPALVTPEVGAAEIVRDANAGLVVPRDVAAWAKALERLLSDERSASEIGRRGRDHVLANCGWNSVAARMESLYEQCASDAARSAISD